METVAAVLFAIAAVGGVTLAAMHLRTQKPNLSVALIHGLFAATGLVVLLIAVIKAGGFGLAGTALVIFLVAALGGFTLISMHLRGKTLSTPLVLGHGLIAVTAFVILLIGLVA
jgi:hypothetical protein